MKYLYVGATPEVDREALMAVRDRAGAEFGAPVREMELPGSISPTTRGAAAVRLDSGAGDAHRSGVPRRCAETAGGDGTGPVHPVLTFVFGHAQLGGRVAVVSLARLRQEFYGLPPNREVFSGARLERKRCTKPATRSGWCTAGWRIAPCRWRPGSGRSISSARRSARLRGAN
jgi:hypothetical protein